jgi:hypothetical protein
MNKKEWCFLLMFFFSSLVLFSQNYRDEIIRKDINPFLGMVMKNKKPEYEKLKENILKLEEDYGYETDLKLKLIDHSFYHKDFDFFKEQLSILVEKYGFNVSYLQGGELYYDAIMKGELSVWFKAMYLQNHFVWMEQNFEKQIDQRKLHDIELKNQVIRSLPWGSKEDSSADAARIKEWNSERNEFIFRNVSDLYKICRKYDFYPTGKNFGVQHNFYNSLIIMNLDIKENIERTWLLFEPYFKKSYLKNDMDYGYFWAYDIFSFSHFGHQKYGLISYDDVPEYHRAKNPEMKTVPIENAFFSDKAKRELGWK